MSDNLPQNAAPGSDSGHTAEVTNTSAIPVSSLTASHHSKFEISKFTAITVIALLAVSLLASFYLWRKLTNMQEHLARQSADATNLSIEARSLAKNAQEVAREASARSSLNETRLSEVALQRSQLDELMQSLSRSRDENLVVDIESALRLAQQQAQLTGSVEPLLAAMKTADLRLSRAAQPRLNGVRRALASDIDKIRTAAVADMPSLLVKLDEISRLVEDLPVVNTVTPFVRVEKANVSANAASKIATSKPSETSPVNDWQTTAQDFWQRNWLIVRTELVKLVRVSRIENPEAVLLTPEQTYFLRENLKLKILNARLGLLGRQIQSAKADMSAVADDLRKYSDPTSKQAQLLQAAVAQVQAQLGSAAIPGLDTSLAALALAAAGK